MSLCKLPNAAFGCEGARSATRAAGPFVSRKARWAAGCEARRGSPTVVGLGATGDLQGGRVTPAR